MNVMVVLAVMYAGMVTIAYLGELFTRLKYRKAIKEMETRLDNLPIRKTVSRAGGKNGKRKRNRA